MQINTIQSKTMHAARYEQLGSAQDVEQVAEAHEVQDSGKMIGKAIIEIN